MKKLEVHDRVVVIDGNNTYEGTVIQLLSTQFVLDHILVAFLEGGRELEPEERRVFPMSATVRVIDRFG